MPGTRIEVPFVRVVDGDTIRVEINGEEESLRILALDTEESNKGSSKPVTPWGREAKEEAKRFFADSDTVMLEFSDNEPLEIALQKHRGNYGRLLVFVYHKDGRDFQEHMIRQGYSPYFVKYGYASFKEHHQRYMTAERDAQIANRGLWDQIKVNGSEIRNYALLGVWWHLRAQIIDNYRRFRADYPNLPVYNTRLDYATLVNLAYKEQDVTIFTELREFKRVGAEHAIIGIGSIANPFHLFIPNIDESPGQEIISLIMERYAPTDETYVRRGYAFVRGPLKLFRGNPEIIVTSIDQIMDTL